MTSPAGGRPPEPDRQSTSRRDRAVSGLLVLVLIVAAAVIALPRAAAVPTVPAFTEQPTGSAAAPVVYREGVVGHPVSITPVTARSRSERTLVGLIFSGLVKLGQNSTLEPDLAASWQTDNSGQVWTVKIRPDAVWQDGQPVTSDDVVYTISALKDPAAGGSLAAAWADVTVAALDASTVQFTLDAPVSGFLAALTQPLLPSHLLADVPMADLATSAFATSPVGSGPYALAQLDATHAVLMPASRTLAGEGASPAPSGLSGSVGPNGPSLSPSAQPSGSPAPPGAPGAPTASGVAASSSSAAPAAASAAVSSPPGPTGSGAITSPSASAPAAVPSPTAFVDPSGRPIERIEVTFFDTEDALASAFKAGQIDGAAGLSTSVTADLSAQPGAQALHYPTTTLSAVLLNLRTTHPELQDPNVRRALLEGIDRNTLAATTLAGTAAVANALIPPGSWAYDASAVGSVPFDRSGAAKLLAKAGWTRIGGKWAAPKAKVPYLLELLTVPADVNPRLANAAAAVSDGWTSLGFKVKLVELSGADLAVRLQNGTFTAAALDIASGLQPDLFPLLSSSQIRAGGSNRSGYQDPSLDKLLAATRLPGSDAKHKAAWSALLAGLAARMPVLPLVWADEVMVARGLSGITPTLIVHTGDRFWDVLAWRLSASR